MPDSPIEEIKAKLNIVDVVADYVQLKKAGVNFRARCPFHNEKTPSFYVSPVRQIWHCFGCGLGGDMFEFIKQAEAADFPQALRQLAERAGVALPERTVGKAFLEDRQIVLYDLNSLAAKFYHKVLKESPLAAEARAYLAKRKFLPATIDAWQVGYSPNRYDVLYQFLQKKGYADGDIEKAGLVIHGEEGKYFDRFRDRIMFPVLDFSGKVVGFSARILHPKEGVGKYINSSDGPIYSKSKTIFGFYQAKTTIRRENLAVIVEGNVDVIKSHQAGVVNVVASSGTALTERQLNVLFRITENLIFAFDADQAGTDAARRALEPALQTGFNVKLIVAPPGLKDADEIIDRDPNLWTRLIGEAQNYLDFYLHRLFDILDRSDPLAKKAAIDKFLSLLFLVPNAIITSHYIHLASQMSGVKERDIADEFNKSPQRRNRVLSANDAAVHNPVSAGLLLEQRFIGLLLQNSKLTRFYLNRHSPEDFSIPSAKTLFERLSSFFGSADAELKDFFPAFPEYSVEAQQAALAVEIGGEGQTIDVELRDLSKRLRLARWNREQERLAREIAAAEAQGKSELKASLARAFNEIMQNMQDIQNDRGWF